MRSPFAHGRVKHPRSGLWRLLARRRFGPLFATNVLGVFNDNLFKTAMLILAAYGLYRAAPAKAALLAPVATGVFILPFFLFSALAGQVADAWERVAAGAGGQAGGGRDHGAGAGWASSSSPSAC